jgi:putative tricarboxylic transport membrane protein
MLFEKQPEVVYGLFLALLVSNVLMVVLGMLFQPLALRAVNVKQPYLLVGIVVIALTGAYTYDENLLSVYVALIFGLIGYAMRKFDFSPASAMLGLVLGSIVEISLRRGLALYDGNFLTFLTRPGSLMLIIIAVVTFVWPLLRKKPSNAPRAAGGD